MNATTPPESAAPTGAWVLKPGGTLSWSPEMYRICGFNPTEGPPSYLQVIAQMPAPDAAEVDKNVQAAFGLHQRLEGECRFIRPDGTIRHLRYVGHPIASDGGTVDFVGIVEDVTDQRHRGGRKLRKVARLMPHHYHSYPPDYRRQWFPVLEQHPDTGTRAQPGYLWVQTPWRLHAMWADHFEIEEREEA